MRRDSYTNAEEALREAKLSFLSAAREYMPMGFVSRRPFISIGGAFLAGVLIGRPFQRERHNRSVSYAAAHLPLGSLLSLATTLIPIFFSRANSSGG